MGEVLVAAGRDAEDAYLLGGDSSSWPTDCRTPIPTRMALTRVLRSRSGFGNGAQAGRPRAKLQRSSKMPKTQLKLM